MKTFVKGKLSRILARVVMAAFVFPMLAATLGTTAAHAQPPSPASVIVFTLENKSPVGGGELADRVTNALKMALEDSGRATVMSVDTSSPTVQRAITVEKSVTEEDFNLPMDRERAARIAKALGAQFAFVGAIEAYRFDEQAKQASLTLTVQKIDAAGGEPMLIGVVGKSGDHKGSNGKEGPLMTEAIDNAVYQVVEKAFGAAVKPGVKPPEAATTKKEEKGKGWERWIIPAVLIGVLIAVGSGGGKGEAAKPARIGSPITTPVGTPTGTSVQLSWGVAATATVGGFNIYRAPVTQSAAAPARATRGFTFGRTRAGQTAGAVGAFVKITSLDGAARSFTDTTATVGSLFVYQIKAIVGGRESNPATCVNFFNSATTFIGPGVPQAPTGVVASKGIGVLAILVKWNPNRESFVTGYRVHRATSAAGPFTQIAQVGSGVTQFNDLSGLTSATTFFYQVGAVGAVESLSQTVSFTAQTGQVAPPTNLQAFPEQNRVRLTWNAPADPSVVGYNIRRDGVQIGQVTGIATTTFTDPNVAAGQTHTYTVRSRAPDGSESVDSNAVTSGPSAPPDAITASAQPTSIVANATSTSALSATVTGSSQPIGGASVTFSTSLGTLLLNGAVRGSSLITTTNSAGLAQCDLRSVRSATTVQATVTATTPKVGGGVLSSQTVVSMVPSQVTSIEVTLSNPNPPGNGLGSTTVTATVKDQIGAGMAGVTVAFSILPELGAFNPVTAATNINGQAQTTLTSTGGFGLATVTATVGSVKGTAQVSFTPPPTVTVSVNPSQLAAGGVGNTALITATVKQTTGEPVADGTLVRFGFEPNDATSSGTGARIAPGEEKALTKNGLAFSHLISPPDLSNGSSDTIAAWTEIVLDGVFTAGSGETKGDAPVTYTDPPFQVTVASDPTSIPADGVSTAKVTADVRTAIPNPIGPGLKPVADGTPVQFNATAGTFVETGAAQFSTTTINGFATGFLQAGTTAGTAVVSASSGAVSGSVPVTLAAVAAFKMEINANPGSLPADGTSTSTITIRIVDSKAQPKPGGTVNFTSDLGSITPGSAVTDANGQATATLRAGFQAGTASVVCRAPDLNTMATKLVTFTGGEAARISTSVVVPALTLPATNGLPSPSGASPTGLVQARVTDKYGNAVQDGTMVQFATDIGQIAASAPTVNGVASATLTSCSFTDATNRATFKPGVSSITLATDTHSGKITDGPFHVVFSGDLSFVTPAGADTQTNLVTFQGLPGGANLRTSAVGGFGSMPSLTPIAGDPIDAVVFCYDANNNPLPAGVPITFEFRKGGTVIATATGRTGLSDGQMVAGTTFSTTAIGAPKALFTIRAIVPPVIDTQWLFSVGQWIGAGPPAGTFVMTSPAGNSWQVSRGTLTIANQIVANVNDANGNPSQDGNEIIWTALNVLNVSYQFLPAQTGTATGKATTVLAVTLLSPTVGGSLTVNAAWARDPERVFGTFPVTVVPPPP